MSENFRKDRAVRALSLCIMQPTVSGGDPQAFHRLHTLLPQLFPQLFTHASCEKIGGQALLLHLPGRRREKPLVFLAHMDVVDAGDAACWTHAPFGGEVKDGYIYGRGAADMKGHLVALLSAAEELLEDGWQPSTDLYFALSCDEEQRGGSMEMIANVLSARGVQPAMVLDEGGSVCNPYAVTTQNAAYVGVAEKGRLLFSLSCEGLYAMEKLARAAARIACIRPDGHLCRPVLTQMLPAMRSVLTRRDRFFLRYDTLFSGHLIRRLSRTPTGRAITHTQINLWKQQGDTLLREKPTLYYSASVLPGDSTEKLLRRIRGILACTDISLTLMCMEEPSAISPAQGLAWDALSTAVAVHFPGKIIVPSLLAGGTDARRMEKICRHVYRFSPFIFSQEEMRRMHSFDERLSIENLMRGVSFFRQLLQA